MRINGSDIDSFRVASADSVRPAAAMPKWSSESTVRFVEAGWLRAGCCAAARGHLKEQRTRPPRCRRIPSKPFPCGSQAPIRCEKGCQARAAERAKKKGRPIGAALVVFVMSVR